VVEPVRVFADLRQAHVRTHHASDGPTQMPDLNQLFRPSASKQEPWRDIKLSTDDVDNLLISEFIHTQAIHFYKGIIFYLIPLYSIVDKYRIIR
jgi:hypothetical protein